MMGLQVLLRRRSNEGGLLPAAFTMPAGALEYISTDQVTTLVIGSPRLHCGHSPCGSSRGQSFTPEFAEGDAARRYGWIAGVRIGEVFGPAGHQQEHDCIT